MARALPFKKEVLCVNKLSVGLRICASIRGNYPISGNSLGIICSLYM